MSLRNAKSALLVAALAIAPSRIFADPTTDFNTAHSDPPPFQFADGAVGQTIASCATGDKCASLVLPDGDEIAVYSGGSGWCKPYVLHVVRSHNGVTVTDFTQTTDIKSHHCNSDFAMTPMQFDGGRAHLVVMQQKNGDLSMQWTDDPLARKFLPAHRVQDQQ